MVSEPQRAEPDDKDWTWVMGRQCPDCGFDPAGVDPLSLPVLFGTALSDWPDVLSRADAAQRPSPQTWSPLEYACHVRDVLRVFTGRVQRMLAEDAPTFASWDQEAAAVEERYWQQDPAVVSREIESAGEEAAVAFGAVPASEWQRTGTRDDGAQFTVASTGVYLLHELVHHAHDVGPSQGR